MSQQSETQKHFLAIVYTSSFPPVGGFSASDRRVRDIARGLRSAGVQNAIIVPRWHKPNNAESIDIDCEVIHLGTLLDSIPILNRMGFWLALVWLIIKNQFTSVLYYSPTIDCIVSQIPLRLLGKKTIVEISDLVSCNYSWTARGALFWLGERVPPRFADLSLPISHRIAKELFGSRSPKPFHVLPVLVDSDDFIPDARTREEFRNNHKISSECVLIGYSGGMYHTYGVDHLIEAFSQLILSDSCDCKLVLAGRITNQPHSVDVRELANRSGVADRIILTDWIPTEKVKQVLNGSDILVIPHEQTQANKAGLPTKIAEYAAMGKAIVSNRVGEIDLYFKDYQDIVFTKTSDAKGLERSLRELVADKTIRDNIGIAAKEAARTNFCHRHNGDLLASLLGMLS